MILQSGESYFLQNNEGPDNKLEIDIVYKNKQGNKLGIYYLEDYGWNSIRYIDLGSEFIEICKLEDIDTYRQNFPSSDIYNFIKNSIKDLFEKGFLS